MLLDLADIARSTGHPVTEVDGWQHRGRPGGMLDVKTITIHETGLGFVPRTDMPTLDTLIKGRAGKTPLPGPLSQFGVGLSGRLYVVAAGLCNHAGVSLANRFTNPHAIGIEIEASGLGLPGDFPDVQLDAAARLAAALAAAYDDADILAHKETCKPVGRKADPHFSMPDFRRRADRLAGTRFGSPTTEDDDMAMNPTERAQLLADIAQAVWGRQHALTKTDVAAFGSGEIGDKKSEEELMRFSPAVARLRREVAELNQKVTALAERLPADDPVT